MDQLPVGQSLSPELVLHQLDVVRGHLVPEAPAAAVDHDHNLADGGDAEDSSQVFIEDMGDFLDLQKMVPCTQRPELGDAPFQGAVGDIGRVGIRHPAVFLGHEKVVPCPISVLHGPLGPPGQDVPEHVPAEPRDAAFSDAGGHFLENLRQQLLASGGDVLLGKIRPQQPDSAVDVITHASGRDDALVHVKGGHSADRKPVSLMRIRHDIGHPLDAGQAGDVPGLLQCEVVPDAL